jgi:hypothetical protein
MSDEKEFGLTNVGTDGVEQVPVESKESTLVPESVNKGLEEAKAGKLLDSPEDFTKYVEKKKRGRPKKEVKPVLREFRCPTCREVYTELTVMKLGAGDGRWAIFCPQDQASLGFMHPDVDEKIAKLHKNPSKR